MVNSSDGAPLISNSLGIPTPRLMIPPASCFIKPPPAASVVQPSYLAWPITRGAERQPVEPDAQRAFCSEHGTSTEGGRVFPAQD